MSGPPKVLHKGRDDNCRPTPKYCTGGGVTIVTPPQSIAQGGVTIVTPPKALHRGGSDNFHLPPK